MSILKINELLTDFDSMSDTDKVNEYLDKLDHPLKEEMKAVRDILINANEKLAEHIKWGAPSFYLNKEDMATFNPQAKKYVHIVFHKGALLHDDSGLLQGDHADRRMVKLHNMEEIEANKEVLEKVVNEWVVLNDK